MHFPYTSKQNHKAKLKVTYVEHPIPYYGKWALGSKTTARIAKSNVSQLTKQLMKNIPTKHVAQAWREIARPDSINWE